ncbi:retrovirus-related pol polyprotein from transposon TNT 1-94 [Tanacetum coccineum]
MQMMYCFVNNIHVDYAELLWEGIYYSLHHPTSSIPYPRFTKIIVSHYMTIFPEISRRARDMYHNLQDDDIMKNIFNSGRHKDKVGMQIPDWMITEEMKHTEHYRMYAEVFGLDVPLTQSQPTESTQGTHRTPSAPRSPTHKKDTTESSAPKRSTVIRFRLPERRSTRLTPPVPVPTVEKADEMILQDTLQVSLRPKSRRARTRENVGTVHMRRIDETTDSRTQLIARSDKESPEVERTNDEEDRNRREKGKIVEESRSTPLPTPIRSPRTHTNHYLGSRETSKRFCQEKLFDTLADHLQECKVESLPICFDTHIKEPGVKKQDPEQTNGLRMMSRLSLKNDMSLQDKKEYEQICMCNTAKEIWKTLLISHQGNNQVKDNKIDLLVPQYEQFVISKDESIDSAFARFNTIITSLKALDECYSSKNYSDSGEENDKKIQDETCLVAQEPNEICLRVDLEPDEWIKDNGCSKYMTGNRKLFSTYKAYNGGNIIFGSNLRGNIIGKGTISNDSLKIDNVEHVDNLGFNLLSIGQICDNKCRVIFFEHDSEITKDGKVIGRGIRKKGLYVMKLGNKSKDKICLATIDENSTLWHRRLGHANMRLIQSLASKELVRNLPKLRFDQHFCDACKIGKQAHVSHKAKNIVSTTRCLELLHMDLFGPSAVRSYGGNRYTLVIVDDYSSEYPELKNESYVLYDRVMTPLAAQLERKPRRDRGTRRGRQSTSSSSAFDQPSLSHLNDDDDDGNDEGTSRASTPSPIRYVNSLTNQVPQVFQNPPNIDPHLEPFYTRQTEIINRQVQLRDEHRGGVRSIGKSLRKLWRNMRK